MSAASQARAIIDAALGGNLTSATRTNQRHELRIGNADLPIRASPVTAVSSVTIDGDTIDPAAYSFTPFMLTREDGQCWPACTPILITYTTGWAEGDEPADVQAAIAALEARLTARPDDTIVSEAADDIRVQYADTSNRAGLSVSERALINKWVRP